MIRNVYKLLALVLILAFVVRVGVMVLLQTWNFPTERSFGHEEAEIAFALANGQGFSWPQTWRRVGPPGAMAIREHPEPTTWKAPINPMIIATAFWIFGSYTPRAAVALELLQTLLAVLICLMLFNLGKRIFNEWVGLLAALMFAVYPTSIHFSVQKIEYGPLLTLFGLLLIQQIMSVVEQPTVAKSAALGVLFGLAALINPVICAFYPFAMLWLFWRVKGGLQVGLKQALTIGLCCGLVILPWLVRNYLVFNQFVFLRPNFSRELVISNFPTEATTMATTNQTETNGNEGQMSAFFNQKAVSLILEKPANFVRRVAVRMTVYWTNVAGEEGGLRTILAAAYYSIAVLGIVGMFLARRQLQAQLLILFVLTIPLPFYVTWARLGRFRLPIEPVLILFTAYTVVSLLSWLPSRSRTGSTIGDSEVVGRS